MTRRLAPILVLAILATGCATVPPDMAEYRAAHRDNDPILLRVLKFTFGDIESVDTTSVSVNGQRYGVTTTRYRGGGASVSVNERRW